MHFGWHSAIYIPVMLQALDEELRCRLLEGADYHLDVSLRILDTLHNTYFLYIYTYVYIYIYLKNYLFECMNFATLAQTCTVSYNIDYNAVWRRILLSKWREQIPSG